MTRHVLILAGWLALVPLIGCGGDPPERPAAPAPAPAVDPPDLDPVVDPEVSEPDETVGVFPEDEPADEPSDPGPTDETPEDSDPADDAAEVSGPTLRGRFIYDGTPPTPAKLAITRDAEVCSAHAPVDESLVVSRDGGLKNVLIWVRDTGLESPPPAEESVVMDNDKCRFAPHVALLHTGQTLELKNSDPVGHNANITTALNPAVNQSIPPGGSVPVKFANEERMPTRVSCGIHPWMNGWVLIRGNSYMAVTAADGSFEISGLPSDRELEFQVWHEKAGFLGDVSIDGTDPGWARGRFKLSLDGLHNLGEIKVPAAAFE